MFQSNWILMMFQNQFFFYETLLHFACKLGNLDIVKYIISLDKIDVSQKAVYLYSF